MRFVLAAIPVSIAALVAFSWWIRPVPTPFRDFIADGIEIGYLCQARGLSREACVAGWHETKGKNSPSSR